MEPARWDKVKAIYQAALQKSPDERADFLGQTCAEDDALRREVESLLAFERKAPGFIEKPPIVSVSITGSRVSWTRGKIIGSYQIISLLGAGGMGEVYLAQDTRLGRNVALKVLPPDLAFDSDRMERFIREAKAAAALNHPNVATIYEAGASDGVRFISMEYVEGQTLEAKLGSGPLTLSEIAEIAVQAADALDEAHARGITHRDIKPANIMLTKRNQVKVLDFGLAKISHPGEPVSGSEARTFAHTTPGVAMGSVSYMSPEQALGHEVDHRSDIFSLGVTIYEMAAGRRPFAGTTAPETIDRILHAEPDSVSRVNKRMPPDLDRIVRKCMEKEKERRYQSAAELVMDLRNLQRDSTFVAVPAQKQIVPHWRRRLGWAVVLPGALLVTGISAFWWLSGSGESGPASGVALVNNAAVAPDADTPPRRLSTGGPPSRNPEANRYFENAIQQINVNLDVERGLMMLDQALALDPSFAEARAWRGFMNMVILETGYANDGALLNYAETELRRAVEDDPTVAQAHAGFAAVYFEQGRKELMPAEVELALKTNPTHEGALHWLTNYHVYNGDYAAAKRAGQQVVDRNPLFFPTRMVLGDMLRQQGDLAMAIAEQEKILEQDPQNLFGIYFLTRAYLDARDVGMARQTLLRARPSDRQNYRLRLTWAILMALEGRRTEALAEMDDEVLKWASLVFVAKHDCAVFYAAVGDTSKALDWLDQAVRSGDEREEYFRRDPLLVRIRNNSRFQAILENVAYRRQQRKERPGA